MSLDLPKIRQTLFIVDKDRKYLFDVNQTITIRSLKKMIMAAANLSKQGLRIFHNGIEYTDKDSSSLEELFPNLQLVEFTMSIVYTDTDELNDYINIKLKGYCNSHDGKYPYFYCYHCNKSICSECVKSGKHFGHDIKEKYDYLQDSRNIIEQLFKHLKDILKDANGIEDDSVEKLKLRIRNEFSPALVEKARQIEIVLIDLINGFLEKEKDNFNTMHKNLELLYVNCASDLDGFKQGIRIEDLIIDDKVFLEIDAKIKNISKGQQLVLQNVNTFKHFVENFNTIKYIVEKAYEEVYKYLDKFLSHSNIVKIKQDISDQTIDPIAKQSDIKRLLSGMKKQDDTTKRNNVFISEGTNENEPLKNIQAQLTFGPHSNNNNNNNNISTNVINKNILVCNVLQGTSQMMIFDDANNKVFRRDIPLNYNYGSSTFLFNCAWVHANNKLYISGGTDSSLPKKLFYCYDPYKDSFQRLPDMKQEHSNHSMFYNNGFIYIAGGDNSLSEKYDIRKAEWTPMKKMNMVHKNPILYIYKNYLYSFFGMDNEDKFVDGIERINLRNDRAKWETVSYSRNDCDMKMYGAGVFKVNDHEIYFLGGKDVNNVRKSAFKFDFDSLQVNKTNITLEENAYFKESMLVALSEQNYGNFSLEENNAFVKLNIGDLHSES